MLANTSPWATTAFGKPVLGQTAEPRRRTTRADIVAFTAMTGDRNPLHYDEALARSSVFRRLIVQGGVTSGLLNALVAEDLPGPGMVFLSVAWSFTRAVGVGEWLTARVEVQAVRDDKPICTLAATILNETGKPVLTGTAVTYTVPLQPTTDLINPSKGD